MECSTKEGEDVREKLDKAILEVMESLKQLSSLRNKYNHAIKEVSNIWSEKLKIYLLLVGLLCHDTGQTCNGRTQTCMLTAV